MPQFNIQKSFPCSIDWEAIGIQADTSMAEINCASCPIDCQGRIKGNYTYSSPVFNPNNASQIAYLRSDNRTRICESEIRVFDLCSGFDKLIHLGACFQIDWSIKDWIIFTGQDTHIWKIKSNGDSLTQLSFNGFSHHNPSWNPKGDKFIYFHRNASKDIIYVVEAEGSKIDSFNILSNFSYWDWAEEDRIVGVTRLRSGSDPGPGYYVPSERKLYQIDSLDPSLTSDSIILEVSFNPKTQNIIWQTIGFIAESNIVTGKRRYLTKGGGVGTNKTYRSIDISPNFSHIVLEREDRQIINVCEYYSEVSLFIVQIDGADELRLLLPE